VFEVETHATDHDMNEAGQAAPFASREKLHAVSLAARRSFDQGASAHRRIGHVA
jgi:hypothetical protein